MNYNSDLRMMHIIVLPVVLSSTIVNGNGHSCHYAYLSIFQSELLKRHGKCDEHSFMYCTCFFLH
jgi:hypothetical protein